MKTLTLSLVLAASFLAPLSAQRYGGINRNAPTVESSITFAKAGKLSISYAALNFGEGSTIKALKENAQARERHNSAAKSTPVGTLTLPAAMSMGGKNVDAGEYGVHFLVNDDGDFVLTLSHEVDGEAQLIQWDLDLQEGETTRQRLVMMPIAGNGDGEATIHLHFGNLACDIPLAPAKKG